MNLIYIMVPMALMLGIGFVLAFMWAAKKGQFDDLDTPDKRMLNDDLILGIKKELTLNMKDKKNNN